MVFLWFSHGFSMVFPSHHDALRATGYEERTDVFSEFLRNVEAERVARLGALNVARRMVSD